MSDVTDQNQRAAEEAWTSLFPEAGTSIRSLLAFHSGNGVGYFRLDYPFMVACEAIDMLTQWRQRQDDGVAQMIAEDPNADLSHDGQYAAYADALLTQTLIAIVVPLLESTLFIFTEKSLREHHANGRIEVLLSSERARVGSVGKNFWTIENVYDVSSSSWKGTGGKIAGFSQLCAALDLPMQHSEYDKKVLEALFWYRNRALHQGLHWDERSLDELNDRMQKDWIDIFSGLVRTSTIGGVASAPRLILPMFTREFGSGLLPWLKQFLTHLGDLDLALWERVPPTTHPSS